MDRYRTRPGGVCQIVMLFLALSAGCRPADGRRADDLSAFYYPVDRLPENGAMYYYANVTDSLGGREVWKLRRVGEGVLQSENLDAGGRVLLRQRDRVVSSGVITDSLTLLTYDSLGARAVGVTIHAGNRMPFAATDTSAVYLTHLEWWQPGDSLHLVLQRRRKFAGDTVWTWADKTLPAVRFTTSDQLETERDGWTNSAWSGEEIYAEGVGLVYYARNISPQFRLAFRLEKIE